MGDFLKFDELAKNVSQAYVTLTGHAAPEWVLKSLALLFLVGVALVGLLTTVILFCKAKEQVVKHLVPIFYKTTERRRTAKRREMARALELRIRNMNDQEHWGDLRFADLEADVEAGGRRRALDWLPFLQAASTDLRLERSLAKALASSEERQIVLEGEPGSGKSVAMRHVAICVAERATKSRRTDSLLPVYVNLRELRRRDGEAISGELVRRAVFEALNPSGSREGERLLKQEFAEGVERGAWLFLFDSFDEIPDILSSVEADDAIRAYAQAVAEFLEPKGNCRGVVASREFRGPGHLRWARFRIRPLSEQRQRELIRRADLPRDSEDALVGALASGDDELRQMARNPMFLGLLCEQAAASLPLARTAHQALEAYVADRLHRDEVRIGEQFAVKPEEVREGAEAVAYCMAATEGLGLGPPRSGLAEAVASQGMACAGGLEKCLDALLYMKLARQHADPETGAAHFSFAHRRFQEYFATCVLLREPERVPASDLLTNGRWREAAVVLLQTQPAEAVAPLMAEAGELLSGRADDTPGAIEDPGAYVAAHADAKGRGDGEGLPDTFPWPLAARHVLDVLQQGLRGREHELPDPVRRDAARIVVSATVRGALPDRISAMEVAGVVPEDVLCWLTQRALSSGSRALGRRAYQQLARLATLPNDLRRAVFQRLVGWVLWGRAYREPEATRAELTRLDRPGDFLAAWRLLRWVPWVDVTAHVALPALVVVWPGGRVAGDRVALAASTYLVLSGAVTLWWWFGKGGPLLTWLYGASYCARLYAWSKLAGGLGAYGGEALLGWYVTLWPAAAVDAARNGQLLRPWMWPAAPVRGVVVFLAAPMRHLREWGRELRAEWKGLVWLAVALSGGFGLLAGISLGLTKLLRLEAKYAGAMFLLELVGLAVVGWARVGYEEVADAWTVGRWRRLGPGQSVGELLRCIVACRRSETVLRVLALAREGDMLSRTGVCEESLRTLGLTIEQEAVRGRGKGRRGRPEKCGAARGGEATTSDPTTAAGRLVQVMSGEGELIACVEGVYGLADDIRRDLGEEGWGG